MTTALNTEALCQHVWDIFRLDVMGRAGEMPFEAFRAMLIALAVVTGKGVLAREESISILNDGWERHVNKATGPSAGESPDVTKRVVMSAVYAMFRKHIVQPWATLTLSAVHGVVLGAVVVVSKGWLELQEVRESFEEVWAAYEVPTELRAG